jgi:hypothetical protein
VTCPKFRQFSAAGDEKISITISDRIMAVRLGKYSQSLCTSAQKYMLCAKILVVLRRNKKIFVVLRRNKVTAQKC